MFEWFGEGSDCARTVAMPRPRQMPNMLRIVFAFIIIRGIQIAKHAPDPFGRYVATGITLMIGINTLINSLVNSGLMPVTGLPMPFVSYGGTSMIFSAAAIGILLNISKYTVTLPDPKKITAIRYATS